MSELVERLNGRRHHALFKNGVLINPDGPDAASELTRLTNENAALRANMEERAGYLAGFIAAEELTRLTERVRVLEEDNARHRASRNEVIEECANVADTGVPVFSLDEYGTGYNTACREVAAAIRSLKEPTND